MASQESSSNTLADPSYSSGIPSSGSDPTTTAGNSNGGSTATQSGKPHGKSITEDANLDDDPENNASFKSDIGSEQDPGRRAVNEMQRTTQNAAGGTAPNQKMGEGGASQYDTLTTEQQL